MDVENNKDFLSRPLLKHPPYNGLSNEEGTIRSTKGRKRAKVNNASCMLDLIRNYAIPKWKKYLRFKSEKSGPAVVVPRCDTVWKKILRDVREFFRILFRVRFHPLEFKNTEGAKNCVKILFEELGIPIKEMEITKPCLFKFIHQ